MASGLTVRHQHGPLTGFHPEELEAGTGSSLQPFPGSQPSGVCAHVVHSHFPYPSHPNLSMTSFKPHSESRCTLPLPPPLTAQPGALRTSKDLLSADARRALKIREQILLHQCPHDLGISSHELILWGPFRMNFSRLDFGPVGVRDPDFCRGSGLLQLRVTERGDETCALLPGPGAPLFRGSALLPPPPPVLLRVYCTEALVGRPVVRLPGSSLQKPLRIPPQCSCPGRILCLWKVS